MSQNQELFRAEEFTMADQASQEARSEFITKTYLHLFGAIIAFIAVEAFVLSLPITATFVAAIGNAPMSWLLVLGAFMGVSYIANNWALSDTSVGMQYAGLGLYIVALSIVFAPLLYIAVHFGGREVIPTAGIITGCVFTGITSVAFFTRKNFSFLGPILGMVGLGALGFIACAAIFGFTLGILFSGAMALFAGASVLYTTSNIIHEYRIGQHVAASLALFASVALMFYYILQILLSLSRD